MSNKYPPFRHIARAIQLFNNSYFSRDCAKLSQSIARNNSWGAIFGAICAILLLLSALLLFSSMPPGIDLCSGHSVIALMAGSRETCVIIARKHFPRIDCAIISERRVAVFGTLKM